MTARSQRGGPTLFAAAGLERDAPRPLADKLRPQQLADVVGQDQLLGPDGALTRMLATRSLGSLVFWGPPGTGKTTVARLLAQATDLHFEQISAIFTGVADLKKVFEQARARRETGQGTPRQESDSVRHDAVASQTESLGSRRRPAMQASHG
jgi:putative ATPase